jgi:hypothetical protein
MSKARSGVVKVGDSERSMSFKEQEAAYISAEKNLTSSMLGMMSLWSGVGLQGLSRVAVGAYQKLNGD